MQIILLIITNLNSYGQGKFLVKGRVTDENGEPIFGVSVLVMGTTTGITTSKDGTYSIRCNEKARLKFTFIGRDVYTIDVNAREKIDLVMRPSTVDMDEVVVVGYATTKKRDLTGPVGSISGAQLKDIPATNIGQMLAGRVSGMQVTQSSGELDASININVRGGTSITQNNSPLIIIDGIPSQSGFLGIAPSDVESIEVLKDASTTAIYGSRGANGVIIVTTKSTRIQKPTLTYETYYGFSKVSNNLKVLDAADFVRLEFERLRGNDPTINIARYGNYVDIDKNYPVGSGVDWQKQAFGITPISQMHRVNIVGGDKITKYNFSYTRNDEGGVMVNSGLGRNTLRLALNTEVNKSLNVKLNASYSNQSVQGPSLTDLASRMVAMLRYKPTAGITVPLDKFINAAEDSIARVVDPSNINLFTNPISNYAKETNIRKNMILTGGLNIDYKFSKKLIYRGALNYTYRDAENNIFYESGHSAATSTGGANGSIAHSYSNNLVYNNTLSYSNIFQDKHDLLVLIGQEALINQYNSISLSSSKFPDVNFGLDDMAMGVIPLAPSSSRSQNSAYSFFSRLNYQYNSKYLLSATLRADGTTKFGINNKWGYFPSGAIAWKVIEENFIKNLKVFSNLKVRFSYGISGNSNIADNLSLNLYSRQPVSVNNGAVSTYGSVKLANPNLGWEKNTTANLGFDLGFFNDRLTTTIDLYETNTSDLLLNSNIPYSSGYTAVMKNIGATRNRGIEFEISGDIIKKANVSWRSSLNMTFNKNMVVSLADGANSFEATNNNIGYIVKVGQPLGQMFGYLTDGIYTTDDFDYNATTQKWILKSGVAVEKGVTPFPGLIKLRNMDNSDDKLITSNDRVVIGNAQPLFYGGFSNTFKYKNFDMSIFLNFTYGNKLFNAVRYNLENLFFSNMNVSIDGFEGRYRYYDDNGNFIKDWSLLAGINKNATKPTINGLVVGRTYSDYVEDGSFLRVNNVSIGYTFPKKLIQRIKVSNIRIYVTVSNIATLTGYKGLDPEVSINSSAITPGLDWGAHPRVRSGIAGLSLTF